MGGRTAAGRLICIVLLFQFKGCRWAALSFSVCAMNIKVLMLLAVLLLTSVFGCRDTEVQAPAIEVPRQVLSQSSQQQAGKRLFLEHCRECHGTTAEGRNPRAARFVPPPPDFLSHRYREVDPGYLYWRIANGKHVEPFRSRGSVMPAWGAYLTKQQIWQLVAYLRQRAGSE